MDFTTSLAQKAEECNAYLYQCFEAMSDERTRLYDSIRYSIQSGGKRLRMIMLLESARLFADAYEDCIPFACAIEMIHTYSLIHDDLPALDNAEYRRGRYCNHKVYGESMAVLTGDGLLHYAFELMLDASVDAKDERYLTRLKAIKEIAACSGLFGMLLGQAVDTEAGEAPNVELLNYICEKKTASMFIGAMKAGAMIAGADEAQLRIISEYARHFGMAFQLTDDILDQVGDFHCLGKSTGRDMQNDKVTIPALLGLQEAVGMACAYTANAKRLIAPLDKYGFFTQLCDYVTERHG